VSEPKILFLDIETAPDVTWSWGVYQENAIAVKEHWYVLSFAARWRGSEKMIVKGLCDYKGYEGGNKQEPLLLQDVWKLLDEADIVVAHNGLDFDIKKLNARFIAHDFDPPSPFKSVDTKRDLKRVAKFSSNRLNWLSKQLGLGAKLLEQHDWELWQGCMEGNKKKWDIMKRYNAHDVELLEELYEVLAPWIAQPQVHGSMQCTNPACGSKGRQKRGLQRTTTMVYQRYQCQQCGAWSRSSKGERASDVVPVR